MGKSYTIKIKSVEEIKEFVSDMEKVEGEVDVKEGRRVVDGKSILGLASLNLQHELEVKPIVRDNENREKFEKMIEKYRK